MRRDPGLAGSDTIARRRPWLSGPTPGVPARTGPTRRLDPTRLDDLTRLDSACRTASTRHLRTHEKKVSARRPSPPGFQSRDDPLPCHISSAAIRAERALGGDLRVSVPLGDPHPSLMEASMQPGHRGWIFAALGGRGAAAGSHRRASVHGDRCYRPDSPNSNTHAENGVGKKRRSDLAAIGPRRRGAVSPRPLLRCTGPWRRVELTEKAAG